MAQRPQGRPQFPPSEILTGLNGGVDGYTDPTQTSYKRWVSAVNVFSGAFGFLQRARFANVVTSATPFAITNVVASGGSPNTITVTTSAPHGFSAGNLVNITAVPLVGGVGTFGVNGYIQVASVPTSTTFTFTLTTFSSAGVLGTSGFAFITYPTQSSLFSTLKFYAVPGLSSYLLGDSNGKLFAFDAGNNYVVQQRLSPFFDSSGAGTAKLNGPWSRETLQNIVYEMNGQVKQSGRGAFAATIEGFGLDAPDASPQVVISSGASQNITNIQRSNGTVTVTLAAALTVPGGNGIGMVNVTITAGDTSFVGTFVVLTGSSTATLTWSQTGQNTALLTPTGTVNTNITKAVGRSYAWAWENANKPHVSAPSPSTQFIQYAAQDGAVQLIQQGTVTLGVTSTVTGSGTAFSSAWVGRHLAVVGGSLGADQGAIVSVQSATQLTLAFPPNFTGSSLSFQVFDPQATHLRLYASADGGATYFRIQRNVWVPSANTLVATGLQFFDNANSEPPLFPFTSEVSQLYNVPPPVGAAIAEYQGRLVVYKVPGAVQSFFYSNSELTSIGMPQESFAPLNQYTLPIQNAQINGWIELPGSAIIWSDRQDMFRLTGLLTDNTATTAPQLGATITRLPYNLGCANQFAVDITPLGAIWVTPQAEIWLYTDRYAPRNIGRPVQDILNSIPLNQIQNIRVKYYHNNTRNWLVVTVAASGANHNTVALVLDLDLLASNGSPSYFVFDMATNQPTWYTYTIPCDSVEVMYEPAGLVRLLTGSTDLIQDADFSNGFGTEIAVSGANVLTHAWGNDSATIIKRPTWFRFTTNRDPSLLASDGWSFNVQGIDDDFYTFPFPLALTLTPGSNDTTSLSGQPNLSFGSPFRHSPELFRIGSVNFIMGRRLRFKINFPAAPGSIFQFRSIQIGFGPSPPR